MENMKLLSIIVPSKNRAMFLKSFVLNYCYCENDEMELIIHDNSDDDSEITNFLKECSSNTVRYFHTNDALSMTENSEMALKYSQGEYVCFMGDDDLFSSRLFAFVKELYNHPSIICWTPINESWGVYLIASKK